MSLVRIITLSWLLPAFAGMSVAQPTPDTIAVLPSVLVKGTPLRLAAADARTERWDSARLDPFQSLNMADLLSRQSNVYVKSYGQSASATTSMRGGSAGHTVVLWNGLSLQSPMLGQLDFSLLPAFLTDEIELHYGGNSAHWGSGAIAGVIALGNTPYWDTPDAVALRATGGSFGFQDFQIKARIRRGSWLAQSRIFFRRANNDFTYRIQPGLPLKSQVHSAMEQSGFLQELYWRPRPNQQLALHLWTQYHFREIPPTTVQNRSEATQEDGFLRLALHWKSVGKRSVAQARAAWFRERLDFRDPLILLQSSSHFHTAMLETEIALHLLPNWRLLTGISSNWTQAHTPAYSTPPRQYRIAPFVSSSLYAGPLLLHLHLRQEITDGRPLPLVPALDGRVSLRPWLNLSARISRNFRLPTFNDLYWQPGGNPDLLPESGWSTELGCRAEVADSWSVSLTAFSRRIDNWILWSLQPGNSLWSAYNLSKVWSRGIEQRFSRQVKIGTHSQIRLSGGYDFVRSTNEIAIQNPRMEAGRQLLYTPVHQAFASGSVLFKNWNIQYGHTFTGAVESVNAGALPGYTVGNFSCAARLDFQNIRASVFAQIHNVWNVNYRVIERRPMPGRHFQLGAQLQWHQRISSLQNTNL